MKGIVFLGFHPDSGHPKLPTLDPNHEFLPLVDVLFGSDFQFEPHIFHWALLVLEKYQCPTFTEKPATCGSRPDLKPKRKRFKTGPSKDLKKRLLLTNVSFMILFAWTNLKKGIPRNNPLCSHIYLLSRVNRHPRSQVDAFLFLDSITKRKATKVPGCIISAVKQWSNIFLQRKDAGFDGSKFGEVTVCLVGIYIYIYRDIFRLT